MHKAPTLTSLALLNKVDPTGLLTWMSQQNDRAGHCQIFDPANEAILRGPEIAQQAVEWAKMLQNLDVAPSTPILIPMRNDLASVVLLLGASVAGLFPILIKPTTPAAVRLETLLQGRGGLMVVPTSAVGSYHVQKLYTRRPLPGGLSLLSTAQMDSGHYSGAALLGILSSGTTGRPKVIVHSFANVIRNAQMHMEAIGLRASDRIALNLPFYFSYGLVAGLFSTLLAGATGVVIDTHRQNPLKLLSAQNLTVGMITPGSAQSTYNPHVLRRLRVLTVGGDYLHAPQARRLLYDAPQAQIFSTYGLSEAGPRVASALLDAEQLEHYQAVPLGTPMRDVHLSLAANDGELLVQTPTAMLGYLNDPVGSASAFGNTTDTIRTGDIFQRRDQFYFFAGRKKRLIVRAGENLYPSYIEAKLLMHINAQDVWVTGEADPVHGERAAAYVVAAEKLDFTQIARSLRRVMSAAQIPTVWYQVDALPAQARK